MVRVRFAPSPTGHLHIGGVRTALFNYLFARHFRGQFILRLEDTDIDRNVPGADTEILNGFRWLGLQWDEGPDIGGPFGPYRCTDRLGIYQEHLHTLMEQGSAYPCFCSSEELQQEREEALEEGRGAHYSGKCRHLTSEERARKEASGIRPNWRYAVPDDGALTIDDLVRGMVQFEIGDIGDFVIMKSNGIPTYNFQVVVDDARMQITHVIRGEEHLSNTPRQLLIYRAFGWEAPKFAHLPQVLDESRKKLSKRDPNVKPVHTYRAEGYLPEAIVNFLALLGWSPGGEDEILTMEQLQEKFDLDRVNRSGAIFDVDKLQWMAGQYLRKLPMERLVQMVQEQLNRQGLTRPEGTKDEWLGSVVGLFREQMACAAEFLDLAKGFFDPDVTLSDEAVQALNEPGARDVVKRYRELAMDDTDWTADSSQARLKQIQAELGVKGRALFMPVRAAATGEIHGRDLHQMIANTSKSWVLARLQRATENAEGV